MIKDLDCDAKVKKGAHRVRSWKVTNAGHQPGVSGLDRVEYSVGIAQSNWEFRSFAATSNREGGGVG